MYSNEIRQSKNNLKTLFTTTLVALQMFSINAMIANHCYTKIPATSENTWTGLTDSVNPRNQKKDKEIVDV